MARSLVFGEAADSPGVPEGGVADGVPVLWVVGDNAGSSSTRNTVGWGDSLKSYFDPAKIRVENRAVAGTSVRSYCNTGAWGEVEEALSPGDYVLIAFESCKAGLLEAPPEGEFKIRFPKGMKFRGVLEGVGDESKSVTDEDGRSELVHTYGWYLKQMARRARARKAKVILCSPTPVLFAASRFGGPRSGMPVQEIRGGGRQKWSDWVKECSTMERAAFLDLYGIIDREIVSNTDLGYPAFRSRPGFTQKDADYIAGCVLRGVRGIPTAPLDRYLSDSGLEGNGVADGGEQPGMRTFTSGKGTAMEGVLLKVDGEIAVIKAVSGEEYRVGIASLSAEDQLFIKEWMLENPTADLRFSVVRKTERVKSTRKGGYKNRTSEAWYEITIENRSRNPLPETGLSYAYQLEVSGGFGQQLGNPNDPTMGGRRGTLKVPAIPAGRSVMVRTNAIILTVSSNVNQSYRKAGQGQVRVSEEIWNHKEKLKNVAVDVVYNGRLLGQYRNGFMEKSRVK